MTTSGITLIILRDCSLLPRTTRLYQDYVPSDRDFYPQASARPAFLLAAVAFALGLGVGATHRSGDARAAAEPTPAPAHARAIRHAPGAAWRIRPRCCGCIDGDTFEARVNLWPGLDVTTRVRLRGIDAPEMKARCDEERIKAEAARDALRAILDQGEVGIIARHARQVRRPCRRRRVDRARRRMSRRRCSRPATARRYAGGHRDGWCR